jgi:hypothetical protein
MFSPDSLFTTNLISVFNFWIKCDNTFKIDVKLNFSDGSQIIVNSMVSSSWLNINLLSYLPNNKTPILLTISANSQYVIDNGTVPIYIDDFTCIILDNSSIQNNIVFDTQRIIGFNIGSINKVQLPEWLNEAESMNINFFNSELTKIQYTVRLNDISKWNLDKKFRDHSLIRLIDSIYGINSDVYLISVKSEYSFNNYTTPWKTNIVMIGDF